MASILPLRPLGVLFGSSFLAFAIFAQSAEAGSVKINVGASVTARAEKGKAAHDDDAAPTFFDQDFSKVAEGSLPKGWTSDNALVKQGKERKYLTTAPGLSERTRVTVQSATIDFPKDWRFEWTQNQASGCDTKLTLGELTVSIGMCWESRTQTVYTLNDQKKIVTGTRTGQRLHYAVEKKGQAVKLLVEGDEVLLARMTDLHPTSFSFRFEAEARVARIRGVDLSEPREEAAAPASSVTTAAAEPTPVLPALTFDQEKIAIIAAMKGIGMRYYSSSVRAPEWVATTRKPELGCGEASLAIVPNATTGRAYQVTWSWISESGDSLGEVYVWYRGDGSVLEYRATNSSPDGSSEVNVHQPASGEPTCSTRPYTNALKAVPCAEADGWSPVPEGQGSLPLIKTLPTVDQVLGR